MQQNSQTPPAICARLLALADRAPRRAVRIARQAHQQTELADTPSRAWAGYTLGYALLQWERTAEAHEMLQQAHACFAALRLTVPALLARRALYVTTLLQGGSLDRAAWEELATAFTAAGLPLEAARAAMHHVWHHNLLGEPRVALALAATIMPSLQAHGTLGDQGRLLRLMAAAHSDCGELAQAFALIEQALHCFERLGLRIEVARCLLERAWHFQRQETFAMAQADLQRAQAIFTRADLPLRLAFCDQHLGLLAGRLGAYDQALALTLRARAAFLTLGNSNAAFCDLNLGIIADYCGLVELALAAYRRAEAAYTARSNRRMVLVSRRNQGLTLHAAGQSIAALDLLNALVPVAEQLGERLELAEIRQAQGRVWRGLRQHNQALQHLQTAGALFTEMGNTPGAAESMLEQGWVHVEQGNLDIAQACFVAARPALHDRPAHRWRVDYGLGCCTERQGQFQSALEYYRAASTTVAQLRQQIISEHGSSAIFEQARQMHSDALRLAWRCNHAHAVLELAEQQRALALVRQRASKPFVFAPDQEIEHIGCQMRLRELVELPTTSDALDEVIHAYIEVLLHARHQQPLTDEVSAIDLDVDLLRRQWSAAYPAGWTTLIYVPCGDMLIIIKLDAETLDMSTTPHDQRLRELLELACYQRHRRQVYTDQPFLLRRTSIPWSTLTELGERLIPPALLEHLHPSHRLLIVPAGMLHGLPWAALRVFDSWLIERAAVQLLPGLQLGMALMSHPSPGNALLLLGVSEFGPRAPALPSVRASLDLAERCWDGPVTRLEDAAVTRHALLALAASGTMRTYGLVQIATHGQLVANQGLLAHLKLANEDLTYYDVVRLSLEGAVVVLVACEGAANEILPGEEVLSLSRAFLMAGARDVIASIWQIHDKAVLPLLEPLYLALKAGADVPTALALAQRTLLSENMVVSSDSDLFMLPFVWASLCAIGSGMPLQVSVGGTKPTDDLFSSRPSD